MKNNREKNGKSMKIRMTVLASLLACAGMIWGTGAFNLTGRQIVAEAKETSETEMETETETETETEAVDPAEQKKVDDLLTKIQEEKTGPAEQEGQTWAVSICNLATGAKGDLNGDKAIQSASIIKTFILGTVFERIVYPVSDEVRIVPSCSEEELDTLMYNMITVSDNDASNRLIELLGNEDSTAGFDVVNDFCEEHGFTATHLGRRFLDPDPKGDNFTSTNDCMKLLSEIANGTLVNQEASEKMLSLLKQQQRRHKIPAGITSNTAVVANKTGELFGEFGDVVQNDIAIVEDGGIHYILCVMSSGLPGDGSTGMALITEISNVVFNAFALIA